MTRRLLTIAVCASWLMPLVAYAQPASDESAKADASAHFKQAEAYRKAGAYDEAVAEYLAAYNLIPKPGFLFNVGLVYEEAGKKADAAVYYTKYLEKEPTGRASNEARARLAALERQIAADKEQEERKAAAALAERKREEEIGKHIAAAVEHTVAGRHDGAIREYETAHELSGDGEYLFDIAEAHRRKGDKKSALVELQRYRAEVPAGKRTGDAIAMIATLEREIANEALARSGGAAGGGAEAGQEVGTSVDLTRSTELPPPAERQKSGVGWTWLALGAAAIATGIAADVVPETRSNGKYDAMDFVPIGLYGLGGLFVYKGVF